jgi:hypothetical protein
LAKEITGSIVSPSGNNHKLGNIELHIRLVYSNFIIIWENKQRRGSGELTLAGIQICCFVQSKRTAENMLNTNYEFWKIEFMYA